MKESYIEIISPICHSNSVNLQKSRKIGIKIQKNRDFGFDKFCLCFLRYRKEKQYDEILPLNSTKTKKGGFYTEISVTTNKD